MSNTLSPVLGGSLDLAHLTAKSLGRVSGRTSSGPGAGAGPRLLRPASQAAGAPGVPTRPASWGGEERVAPGGAQPKLRIDAAPAPLLGGRRLRGMSRRLQRRRRPAVWGVGCSRFRPLRSTGPASTGRQASSSVLARKDSCPSLKMQFGYWSRQAPDPMLTL